jgi:hypothetical protein
VTTAALFVFLTRTDLAALHMSFSPLHVPPLPLLPTVALLIGALAGVVAPPVPVASRPPRAIDLAPYEQDRVDEPHEDPVPV